MAKRVLLQGVDEKLYSEAGAAVLGITVGEAINRGIKRVA